MVILIASQTSIYIGIAQCLIHSVTQFISAYLENKLLFYLNVTSSLTSRPIEALVCCRLCLEREQQRYITNNTGHISKVKHYGNSSTCTLKEHLRQEHHITINAVSVDDEEFAETQLPKVTATGPVKGSLKQQKLSFKRKVTCFEPYTSQFELNRDMTIWAVLDLQPFTFVEDRGMKFFFEKNFPQVELPSRNTLSRTGLFDVYEMVMGKVKHEMHHVEGSAVCLMFDGWTDKYKRYPYLGLRMAYITSDWVFRVITVSCKVVEKHSADSVSAHIREEMKLIGLDLQKVQLFTAHDGAPNMVKTSQQLRVSHYQHCVAHCLHLLLMKDGINRDPELVDLLEKCKTAISRLVYKSCMLEDEKAKSEDRVKMSNMLEKLMEIDDVLRADENVIMGLQPTESPDDEQESAMSSDSEGHGREFNRQHKTLKQSCITRWNSVLTMITSVLCLWHEMSESLKRNGDREYCLTENDKELLTELKDFLQPFQDLTELVSCEQPHLGLILLVISEVKDAARHNPTDSENLKKLKDAVMARLHDRIQVSEAVRLAALLDPALRRMVAVQSSHDDSSEDSIKKLLKDHTLIAVKRKFKYTQSQRDGSTTAAPDNASASASSTSNSESTLSSKKRRLLEKFENQSQSLGDVDLKQARAIESEVHSYLNYYYDVRSSANDNPMQFWKTHQQVFPNLAVLARNYLCLTASSVPVEEMFSSTGILLNQKRSSMAPCRANVVSFLHDNYHQFFPLTYLEASGK